VDIRVHWWLGKQKNAGAASKPGSVPESKEESGNGHSSGTPVARRLKQPTRKHQAGRPQALPYLVLHRVGFAELPLSPAGLVSSYLAVSPLP